VPISAVDCVQPAIQHARAQLFANFRWGQWSRLALVGILAAEIHAGGCNFGNLGQLASHPKTRGDDFLPRAFPHIDPTHLSQFIGLIVAAIFVAIVVAFIFLYISSVFRFILFDSVLRRQCSIGEGWQRWRRAGGRFFLWQLVFQISAGLFFLVLIGVPLAIAAAAGWIQNPEQALGRLIGGGLLLLGLILFFVLVAVAVQVLAKDFLVPIMALEGADFADGWSRLLEMMRLEPGKYAVYLLLKLVLSIAAAILFGIIAIFPALAIVVPAVILVFVAKAAGLGWTVTTVSLAVILGTMLLLLLIYLIALVSVPATVFFPAYSIYFFASRYPNLDALLHPASPTPPERPQAPAPEPPPLPPSPEPIG